MYFIAAMLPLLFVLLATATANLECPPQSVEPCSCHVSPEHQVVLTCKDLSNSGTLIDIFTRTGDRRIHRLILQDSSIASIPAAFLTDTGLENIDITNSRLGSLFDDIAPEDNVVSSITASKCVFRRGWSWNWLTNLEALETLEISDTRLTKLNEGFVERMPSNIKLIKFTSTHSSSIKDRTFEKLVDLNEITIKDSRIKELKRTMFSRPAEYLKTIDFSVNSLTTLPIDFFEEMPQLRNVYFNSNKFTTIDENIFGRIIDNLENLMIANNPMKCDCKLEWIKFRSNRYGVTANCETPLHGIQWFNNLDRNYFDYCHV